MQHRHLIIARSATAVLPALVPDRLIENVPVLLTALLAVLGLVLLIIT